MEWSARSSVGLVRSDNEDRWAVQSFPDQKACLAMVADGIGGYEGGELASTLAVKWATRYIEAALEQSPEKALEGAFHFANEKIAEAASKETGLSRMGTTLTVALMFENESCLYVGHVGDSRAYIVSGEGIRQITDDHSVVGELVRNGTISQEDAKKHPGKNLLTNALGTGKAVSVALYREDLKGGDLVLLCTDGLTDLVDPGEIQSVLRGETLPHASQRLVDLANSRGGHDNVTVVIVDPKRPGGGDFK